MFGLTVLGEIEWKEQSYEFDLTRVMVHPSTHYFYWADDKGCSCPIPFEYVTGVGELEFGPLESVLGHLMNRWASSPLRTDPNKRDEVTRLVSEIMKAS